MNPSQQNSLFDFNHVVVANSAGTLCIQLCLHCGKVRKYAPGISMADFANQTGYYAKKHQKCRDRKPLIALEYRASIAHRKGA